MIRKLFKFLLVIALSGLPISLSKYFGLFEKPTFLKLILYSLGYNFLFRLSKDIWNKS